MVQRKTGVTAEEAARYMGQPVCIVSKTGRCYVGAIQRIEGNTVYFTGHKSNKMWGKEQRAQVQGLLGGLLGGMLGNGASGSGSPFGAFNPFNMLPGIGSSPLGQTFGPNSGFQPGQFRIGLGAMQFLLPLLSRFLI